MARVQKFWCDLCGAEECTTETEKPKTWSSRHAVRAGKVRGSVTRAVLCPKCEEAIKELSGRLAGMIKELLERSMDAERPTLTGLAVLRMVSDETVILVPGEEPRDSEIDADDDEDEDESVTPKKKRRGIPRPERRRAMEEDGD